MRRLYLLIAIGVLLASVLSACAVKGPELSAKPVEPAAALSSANKADWEVEWDRVVQAGKREGVVSGIYTQWESTARAALTKAFGEKYGIELEFNPVSKGTQGTMKLTAERRAGLYMTDVIGLGGTTVMTEMKPAGIPGPIEPMLILPDVKDPKNWMGGKLFLDKDRFVIGMSATYNPYLDRNTEQVKEGEIKSYMDLLDPKWKGKIVMGDPTVAGSGNSWERMIVKAWGMDKARDYLRQLAKQEPMIIRDLRLSAEWLARGKYPVGLALHSPSLAEFQKAGAPVARVRVKEGGSVTASGSCLSVPAGQLPHPNAARVFINWLLTKEGQTIFANGIFRPSARLDVPLPDGYSGIVPLPGDPVYLEDEESMALVGPLIEASKEIFGPLVK
ncbi:MAG: extracellular solute-binding protein [Chloroflexi bacterium]|nr:extracellular solute-binding protein [Chloroflexota bacterium]